MSKNKYDFIIELLEYKKLSPPQKERILKLSAQEIKNENTKDDELLRRIEKIEELVNPTDNEILKDTTPLDLMEIYSNLPTYIDPKDLYIFLKDYNTDPILKTSCHEIDSYELENIRNFCKIDDYDFKKHKQKVQERFLEFVNDKKYFVEYKIKNLMYVYITGKTYLGKIVPWTEDKLAISWNSESLANWCETNKHKIPHPNRGLYNNQGCVEFEIKPSINTTVLGTKKLRSFSDLILHFKYLFHIRADNSLLEIIRRINCETENWKNEIQFEIDDTQFPENLEFFTNVEKLITTYKALINLILDVVAKNKLPTPIVKLTILEFSEHLEFSIHHTNSVFQKSIQNTIERDGQTFFNLIKYQINGLCDLHLKADFGNKKLCIINLWDGRPKSYESLEDENFEGVAYYLIFKK